MALRKGEKSKSSGKLKPFVKSNEPAPPGVKEKNEQQLPQGDGFEVGHSDGKPEQTPGEQRRPVAVAAAGLALGVAAGRILSRNKRSLLKRIRQTFRKW